MAGGLSGDQFVLLNAVIDSIEYNVGHLNPAQTYAKLQQEFGFK
jgi:hypothetical protein